MKEWFEQYGADREGNRGVQIHCYELDKYDEDIIKEQICQNYSGQDYDENIIIFLFAELTQSEIEIDVKISDYLTKEEFNILYNQE